MSDPVQLVRVVRSGLEESVHLGHVAVCDADGRLVGFAGDPARRVFARSSMKPVQAAVSMSVIGDDLSDAEVAVMCASHNGEPIHVRTVRRILRRAGLPVSALRCPPGWPLDPASMARAVRPRPELNNCSGKHAGMLLACVRAGWHTATYPRPGHPLQRRVRRAVLLGTGLETLRIGVDGCGVPVHGMPLFAMATLFARLASPERWGPLAPQLARCTDAMRAEPYLVAGRDRTDTALMEVAPGLVVKYGAEALACAAVPEAGLGVAVKIADGSERASGPGLVRTLQLLGALTGSQLRRLAPIARRPVIGGGRPVGEVVADFQLRAAPSGRG